MKKKTETRTSFLFDMLDLDSSGTLNKVDIPLILDVVHSDFKSVKSNNISSSEWNSAVR
jgi:hypothetical protein